MPARVEREAATMLGGTVQVGDACLGGERAAGTAGRASDNHLPAIAAAALNDQGHPSAARNAHPAGRLLTLTVITDWGASTPRLTRIVLQASVVSGNGKLVDLGKSLDTPPP
jgi:hypothetical protein